MKKGPLSEEPLFCAHRARMKVSSTFSKVAGSRDSVPGRAPQSAEPPLCLLKRRRGVQGGTLAGGSPFCFLLGLYVCAVTLGGGRCPSLPFDPISLVLAQRNGVEPPKKSAFLPRRLHHPRERCQSVDGTFLARLGEGSGGVVGLFNLLTKVRFLRASKDMGVIRLQNIS